MYVNGKLLDTVIEYKTDEIVKENKKTKVINRIEGGKHDKKSEPIECLPYQWFCSGRRERDLDREEREFIEGCWLSVIRDPWLLTFFIITILLLACFVFLLWFDLPYSEEFSIICLLFSLVLSVVFFMSKTWQIPIIVFYMITLLIGHYYSVNSLWAVFKYLFLDSSGGGVVNYGSYLFVDLQIRSYQVHSICYSVPSVTVSDFSPYESMSLLGFVFVNNTTVC